MDVTFDCPYCDHRISADTTHLPNGRVNCPGCHEVVLVPAGGIEPGMKLGDFRIERCLGVGGMGEVFLAVQEAMDREVALKVLPPAVTGNKALVDRFLQEARMAGKLEHPNIVTAFYAGQDKGYYYLAMSYVEGEDLEARIKREGRVPEAEAVGICVKVARALDYAWEKYRLLHRDLKPANIMIAADGEVKLMDMGIAKALTEDSNLTMAGVLLGTPFYMSPEQAKNVGELDCRSDIYALGGTLFHLVTGSRPYDGPTAISVVAKHLNDPVPSAQVQCPDVSLGCARLIGRMMAKDRERRPESWSALAMQLEGVLEQAPRTLQLKVTESQERRLERGPAAEAEVSGATLAPLGGTMATEEGTMVGRPPVPRTAQEYVDSLPPNPAMPRSLKLAFGSIMVLLGALLFVWVSKEGYEYAQRRAADKAQVVQSEHDRRMEEQEVVSDVEARIAAERRRVELTQEERILQQRLQEMLEHARSYRREHPEDLEGAREMLLKVRERAAGTKFELMVEDDLRGLRQQGERLRQRQLLLAGAWKVTEMSGGEPRKDTAMDRLQLRLNGSMVITTRNEATIAGTWRVARQELILRRDDESVLGSWPFEVQANVLTLRPREGIEITLQRDR